MAEINDPIKKVLKISAFAVVSLLIVAGNYFIEAGFEAKGAQTSNKTLSIDYINDTVFPDSLAVLRFAKEQDSGIKNDIGFVSMADISTDNLYIFKVDSGKFWGNFSLSDLKIDFIVDRVVIMPDNSAFDVSFDGSKLDVSSYDGDTYVGILPKDFEFKSYSDWYSSVFVNRLLVPRDSKISISVGKIDDRTSKLLYSKLIKEFKYSIIPQADKEAPWAFGNMSKDKKFVEKIKQETVSGILKKGASGVSSSFISWLEENLTFTDVKKNEIILNTLTDYLNDALYYSSQNDLQNSKSSLEKFNIYLKTLPVEMTSSVKFNNLISDYLQTACVFTLDDKQYDVYKALVDEKFLNASDKYKVIGDLWKGVYKGLNVSDAYAKTAFNTYYDKLDKLLGNEQNLEFYQPFVTYQNQLFDNLFMKYPVFYKDEYFTAKAVLEKELLGLYGDGQLKNELKQDLISDKIDFLKRLMKFFFDGKVEVVDAKKIVASLFSQINELMPTGSSDVAVISIFETQVKDLANFWGYLNTPEYSNSTAYGPTHKERYSAYVNDQSKIWDIMSLKADVLGEENVTPKTAEDVKNEVTAAFAAAKDITDLKVGEISDPTERYVPIDAIVGGYSFSAVYDREKGFLKDVTAYNEKLSDKALKIDSILPLLMSKFADLNPVADTSSADQTEEGFAQRSARAYVAREVAKAGFIVDLVNVAVADGVSSVYRVSDVVLKGYDDVKVTFDFVVNGAKAKNVMFSIKGNPLVMEGEYTLEELAKVVVAEKDFTGKIQR